MLGINRGKNREIENVFLVIVCVGFNCLFFSVNKISINEVVFISILSNKVLISGVVSVFVVVF